MGGESRLPVSSVPVSSVSRGASPGTGGWQASQGGAREGQPATVFNGV